MKTKEETEEMYNFIGFFNDGRFMNQDYRQGIIDALSFVLYEGEVLGRIKRHLSTLPKAKELNNDINNYAKSKK